MRVVQVGDVAAVAPALADALRNDVEVISIALRQRGAQRRGLAKLLFGPLRLIDAANAARLARSLKPDVVHVHWVPNGIVGLLVGTPWVLHVHGSDLRGLDSVRSRPYGFLVRAATRVVYATPDLAPLVLRLRPDATYLPAPIPLRTGSDEREWDVLVASRAALSKGSDVAAAAVARLLGHDPELRIAAVDGPDFASTASRLPFGPKETFIERLARSRVVIGQFRVPALGISELEAMSVARPVVTNVDLALYPEPPPVFVAESAEAAAQATSQLLDRPEEADALGLAGQRWVRARHSQSAVAAIALAVYGQAIGTSAEAGR